MPEILFPHVVNAFHAQPWAILPEKYEEIRGFLALRARGGEVSAEEVQKIAAARQHRGAHVVGKVALLPIMGVLAQRVGLLEAFSGGQSTEQIGRTLDGLVEDKAIRAIVLHVDSPGGSVFGLDELASKIRAARNEKKLVGVADSVAASAAYWLLSQASEVNVTPGGQVGSIGVIAGHLDVSQWEAKEGFKTTWVTSAPHKAEHAAEAPLSAEARGELQSKVDHYHSVFVASVAKGRGVTEAKVEKDFGKGRMLTAQAAVNAGMADRVATLDQVLKRLGAEGADRAAASARARAVEVE